MANRRFGGGMGGGPQRGNRPFISQHQYPGGQGVNPWQGGVAPNNSNTPSGLLSQLSTPQQLALALTSLLQPQQQQQQNNPPSLLSLNTAPFSGHDHYDSQNRFGNRGRSDFRRLDSYKQNRNNNWRTETNRRNHQQPYNKRNNNSFNKSRSQDRTSEKLKQTDSKPKTEEKPEKEKSKDETADNTIDLSVDEGRDEETKEKKRDWKEEKNVSDDKEKEEEKVDLPGAEKKSEKDETKREGRYHGVPAGYLHCFVCNKSMWDGESFQNHLRGKAHKQMLQSLEESFQITVNILRENMRLKEEQKMIELNRMHRNNRNFHHKIQEPQSSCNMCDLKFMGKIIVHRKTEGHQRLKRFLHPNCDVCNKEFPARMEWVQHKFTPEHLRALKESLQNKEGGADGAVIVENLELDLEPLLEESLQNEDDTPVLELSDDMTNFQNRIPAYKKTRPISKESLKPSTGFLCNLCNRFFPTEEIAQAHLKTQKHYNAFVEAAKNKYKRAASDKPEEDDDGNWKRRKLDDESAVEEDSKEKKDTTANGGNEMYDPEEACNENETNQETEKEAAEKPEDDKWAEIDEVCTKENADEQVQVVEIKEEPVEETEEEAKVTANSPRTRRTAATARTVAGPKAKRGRK